MYSHTEEKPYDKSIYTGEEPHIYDFISVSSTSNSVHKSYPLSNLLVKLIILFTETVGHKVNAYSMLKSSLFILFCKSDADFHQRATFIL